ncbi:serine hydrolase [Pseudovibrio exalbescens]|uniref:serine hydrolase n=1 Tax=Pseudovibrio exalbescens TaxID=197461 RepID=UPI00236512A8|nr:serine hydrolase [Pseudovibrio exalbescens]MDD7910892.1 serine hydrolase [Pseudovibrio exalbescens]
MRLLQEMVQGLKNIQAGLQKLSPAKRLTPEAMALRAMTPEDLIFRIWAAEPEDLSMFSSGFLQVVAPDALKASLQQARSVYGPAVEVARDHKGPGYLVTTQDFVLPVLLDRARAGHASGFFIKSPRSRLTNIQDILQAMRELAPRHSHLLIKDGHVEAQYNAQVRLAIGSSFKMWVLEALRAKLKAGNLKATQKLRLSEEFASLPGGLVSGKNIGGLQSVKAVTQQMIANSDNSAADLIINLVGARTLDGADGRTPFLTTRQFFQLKADPALADRYAAASTDERLAILAELADRPLPGPDAAALPYKEGLQWYASAEELCEIIEKVGDDPAMKIFLGAAEKADWHHVAYKGGSEIGVLNFTYQLETKGGTKYRLSATWNDPSAPINEPKALALMASLLEGFKKA